MTDKPILFSTPMAQAILEGRKTQTRRVVKKSALDLLEAGFTPNYVASDGNAELCPFGKVGGKLWVRETWLYNDSIEEPYAYKADYNAEGMARHKGSWKPSIFMPKEACRLWLEIQEIGVERLQAISEEDARSEGVDSYKSEVVGTRYKDYIADASGYGDPAVDYPTVSSPIESFKTLWESINGKDSWALNPWVWVVKFKMTAK